MEEEEEEVKEEEEDLRRRRIEGRVGMAEEGKWKRTRNERGGGHDFRHMSKKCPDISAKCTDVKFTAARGHEGLRESKGHRYRRQCRNRDAARYGISFVPRFLIGTEWYAA